MKKNINITQRNTIFDKAINSLSSDDIKSKGKYYYNNVLGELETVEDISIKKKHSRGHITIRTRQGTKVDKILVLANTVTKDNSPFYFKGEQPLYLYETVDYFMTDLMSTLKKHKEIAKDYLNRYKQKITDIENTSEIVDFTKSNYPEELI